MLSRIPYIFGPLREITNHRLRLPAQPQYHALVSRNSVCTASANQFRPGPPPALTSDSYGNAFNQIKSLGIVDSTTATSDEALTGRFWNGAIQNYGMRSSQTLSLNNNLTTAQNARLFALLNLSFADDVIAFYDAKYTYNLWRPVTAIRAADSDNNPETAADPNWLPESGRLLPTPPTQERMRS